MARAAAEQGVVVALTSFVGTDSTVISKGDLFALDDPVVKKHRTLFGPVVVRRSPGYQPPVEQATAAPGEKRGA